MLIGGRAVDRFSPIALTYVTTNPLDLLSVDSAFAPREVAFARALAPFFSLPRQKAFLTPTREVSRATSWSVAGSALPPAHFREHRVCSFQYALYQRFTYSYRTRPPRGHP